MTVHFHVLTNPEATVSRDDVLAAGQALIPAVQTAAARINSRDYAADEQFRRCFCAASHAGQAAEVQALAARVLGVMDRFLRETSNTITVQPRGSLAEANVYAYVYPDLGRVREVGQWFIYLGPLFNAPPRAGIRNMKLQKMAHEVSHHFGTNGTEGYRVEHYEEDALLLPGRNPIYAAHNAENYAYFIDGVA